MLRKYSGLIVCVVILLIFGGIYFSNLQNPITINSTYKTTVASPLPTKPTAVSVNDSALLIVENGTVVVTHIGQKKTIDSESVVEVGDTVNTSTNAHAMVIFPDNNVLRLDSNTEIVLAVLNASTTESTVSIQQNSGNSWSHVARLVDRKQKYTIETPTLVATVRGTVFNVNIDDPHTEWIGVTESLVDVMRKGDHAVVQLKKDEFASVQEINLTGKVMDSTKMNSPWFQENKTKDSNMEAMMTKMGITNPPRYFLRDNRKMLFMRQPVVQREQPKTSTTALPPSGLEGTASSSIKVAEDTLAKPTDGTPLSTTPTITTKPSPNVTGSNNTPSSTSSPSNTPIKYYPATTNLSPNVTGSNNTATSTSSPSSTPIRYYPISNLPYTFTTLQYSPTSTSQPIR